MFFPVMSLGPLSGYLQGLCGSWGLDVFGCGFWAFVLVLGITVVLVVIFCCIFFGLILFFGAFSRYPLQSFLPNPGTKGFPLLSGLGLLRSPAL